MISIVLSHENSLGEINTFTLGSLVKVYETLSKCKEVLIELEETDDESVTAFCRALADTTGVPLYIVSEIEEHIVKPE